MSMPRQFQLHKLFASAILSYSFLVLAIQARPQVFADDFQSLVQPLLNKNCLACHNAKNAEGGLDLESYEKLMIGGDSGTAVVAGEVEASELIVRIRATDDSVMPPTDNNVGARQLTEVEIEQIARWIQAGAQPPASQLLPAIEWREISKAVQPIYSLQTTEDGNYLSFAKANVVYLVPNPLAEGPWNPQPLIDTSLLAEGGHFAIATDKDLIHSLAFSHNSQQLAVGGFRTVKLYERQIQAQPNEQTNLATVSLIPQGGAGLGLLAVDRDLTLVVLEHETQAVTRTVGSLSAPAIAAAWAHDHSEIFVIDQQHNLFRWQPDPSDYQAVWNCELLTTTEPLSDVIGLTANAAGQLLMVTRSGTVERLVQDGAEWRQERVWEFGTGLSSVYFNSDGQLLLVSTADNAASIWRVTDGQLLVSLGESYQRQQFKQQLQRQIARQTGWIQRLNDMTPGLEEAVKKEEEARIKVAENHQKTGETQAAKLQEIVTAQQTVTDTEQAIAALEQQLVEKRQQLLDQQKLVTNLQAQLVPLEMNVAKALQALASADAGLQLAKDKIPAHETRIAEQQAELTQNQEKLAEFTAQPGAQIVTATFDSDSRQVLLLTESGQGLLYRVDTGIPVAVLEPPVDWSPGQPWQILTSRDRTTVQAGEKSWDWDLSLPWNLVRTWGNERDDLFSFRVTALAFSPDDTHLAVGSGPPSRYGDLKVISLETGEIQQDYGQVHSDTILAVQYSPDGKWLASAGADKLCRLFDPQSGQLVKILEGHTHFVQSLSWQDHAQTLATASADKTVKTWDVETGERRQSIGGFGKEVSAIAFVSTSDQLMTVGLDGHPRLHRGDNAQLVRNFAHNPQPLYTLSLSHDGKHVFVGDHQGSIRVYQVEDGKQIRQWPE